MPGSDVTMRKLRPLGDRVTLLASPVDEEQRDSGLIVPIHQNEATFARGVILDTDPFFHGTLTSGSVVYFLTRLAIKIGDVYVVDLEDVIAYEADE